MKRASGQPDRAGKSELESESDAARLTVDGTVEVQGSARDRRYRLKFHSLVVEVELVSRREAGDQEPKPSSARLVSVGARFHMRARESSRRRFNHTPHAWVILTRAGEQRRRQHTPVRSSAMLRQDSQALRWPR